CGATGGAAGTAGGAAGALAAGGSVAGTIDAGREDSLARAKEVIMKTIATAVVIFPRMVGVPMEPNTAWLPAPPNAEPMSAPFPACSSTIPMIARQTNTWTTMTAMYTSGS